ncbi:MAG: hypothetical protein J5497_04485 [Selenomonadaceae bacterium]|nr:hypothetical protein [Selenomonadaceae bacterium]
MATAITINATTQDGKRHCKTITDINPKTSNAQLKEFAQALNELTTNTYGGTNRIETSDYDSADDAD